MKFSVELHVTVRGNFGAIFMSDNITVTSHAKKVDIRYKDVIKYVENGIVKIMFVKSAEDDRNILTNNLSGEFHDKH